MRLIWCLGTNWKLMLPAWCCRSPPCGIESSTPTNEREPKIGREFMPPLTASYCTIQQHSTNAESHSRTIGNGFMGGCRRMSLTGLYGASEVVMNMPIIPCVERQGIILSFIFVRVTTKRPIRGRSQCGCLVCRDDEAAWPKWHSGALGLCRFKAWAHW